MGDERKPQSEPRNVVDDMDTEKDERGRDSDTQEEAATRSHEGTTDPGALAKKGKQSKERSPEPA
jgi:hypothetical protein